MIHQPLGGAQGQATDVKIRAERLLAIRDRMNKLLSDMTSQDVEKIEKDTERDNFMTAEEAVAYGLVDEIIVSRK